MKILSLDRFFSKRVQYFLSFFCSAKRLVSAKGWPHAVAKKHRKRSSTVTTSSVADSVSQSTHQKRHFFCAQIGRKKAL